jgi:hypothetical protein
LLVLHDGEDRSGRGESKSSTKPYALNPKP